MNKNLLDYLKCPACHSHDLNLTAQEEDEDRVISGSLNCPKCSATYPIKEGVVNFLEKDLGKHTEKVSKIFSDNFVQEYKDRWIKSASRLTELKIKATIKKHLAGQEGKFFIDIGAGFCKYSQTLHEIGVRSVAVDVSEDMLMASTQILTPEENAQIDKIVADSSNLPFRDDKFDGYLCINVFQYLEQPEASLSEAKRACHNNALFSIHLINLFDLRLKYFIFYILMSIKSLIAHKQMMDGYRNIFSISQMKDYLDKNHLATEKQTGLNLFLPLEDTILNKVSSENGLGKLILKVKTMTDALFSKIPPFSLMYNAYICSGKFKL